jgi:hypothetical protein
MRIKKVSISWLLNLIVIDKFNLRRKSKYSI